MWERIVLRIKSISDDFVAERETANPPLVSVITVVLNNPEALKSTIKSVLAQTYLSIEFVIVDGDYEGSILRAFLNIEVEGSKWRSLPDSRLSREFPRLFPSARKDRISPALLKDHIILVRVGPTKDGTYSVIRELLELKE